MREYHVLNLGAGVQSTALFLLARDPDPKVRFDLAIFADTGEEPSAVYTNLEYLRALGSPEIWVRSAGSLGDDLIHGRNSTGQRFASMPLPVKAPKAKPAPKPPSREATDGSLAVSVEMVESLCREHLNQEYAVLCRKLAEKLARKRPSPLTSGKPATWACRIVRTIGWVCCHATPIGLAGGQAVSPRCAASSG